VKNRTVWIIGASTGIGKDLALAYSAHEDCSHIVVSARSEDKLAGLKSEIEKNGCECTVLALDVTKADSISNAEEIAQELSSRIDTIVYNAGTCEYMDSSHPDVEMARRVLDTNYFGAIEVTRIAVPLLREAKKEKGVAKLVYVASSVTYQALPRAHAYGASKAALRYFAECMKIDLQLEGIDVQVVSPGFVDTPMTEQNDFDMPFIIKSKEAAAIMLKGIESGVFDISFPKKFTWTLKSLAKLPTSLRFNLLGKMSRHENAESENSPQTKGR
jgi:short-subunit dehydrogenase